MTFDEWWDKTYFAVGSAIGLDKESMRISWNAAHRAGQLAMRERATDAVDEFDACSPHYIADKIRQLEPE